MGKVEVLLTLHLKSSLLCSIRSTFKLLKLPHRWSWISPSCGWGQMWGRAGWIKGGPARWLFRWLSPWSNWGHWSASPWCGNWGPYCWWWCGGWRQGFDLLWNQIRLGPLWKSWPPRLDWCGLVHNCHNLRFCVFGVETTYLLLFDKNFYEKNTWKS